MSYSVYVSKDGGIPEDFFNSFNEAFEKLHDPEHDLKFDFPNGVGTHGCTYIGGEDFYTLPLDQRFIDIMCHWDFEHMVETAKDACTVLIQLTNKVVPIPVFSATKDTYKHNFLGYEVRMSW